VDSDADEVRIYEPDPFVWDAREKRWRIPELPGANDPVLVRDGLCSGSPLRVLVSPETDEMIIECSYGPYIDATGRPIDTRKRRIHAIGRGGLLLTSDDSKQRWVLQDRSGGEIVVDGLPLIFNRTPLVRAHETGFWILPARITGKATPHLLWYVDAAGRVSRVGEYPNPPDAVQCQNSTGFGRIDGEGNTYEHAVIPGRSSGSSGVVVRFPLNGHSAEIVYDEAVAKGGVFKSSEQSFFVRLGAVPLGVTGP
jgi:hypothetical protein